jgi:threonine/homoserine/homoserine lactone efflux protein
MTLAGFLVFAAAYAMAVISPGPGVMAVVGHVLGRGVKGVTGLILGIAAGDIAWLTAAALGLAMLAQGFALVFLAVKWAGALYLVWLAVQMWRTGGSFAVEPQAGARGEAAGFLAGLSLTLGNPKTISFYLALLPVMVDLPHLTVVGFLEIVALILVVVPAIMAGYALVAWRARGLFASATAMRRVNRLAALALAGAAGMVAMRG